MSIAISSVVQKKATTIDLKKVKEVFLKNAPARSKKRILLNKAIKAHIIINTKDK